MNSIVIRCTNDERARKILECVIDIQEAAINKLEEENRVLKISFECLEKRLTHLLQSKYIASFDEVDTKTNTYKRNIKDVDEIASLFESERMTAKKPDMKYSKDISITTMFPHCPGCGELLDNENYCMNCGQKIDWSD